MRMSVLLGLAPPGVRGGGGGEGLGEGGGQSGGGVSGVVPGQGELSAQLEVIVLDGLVARLETGRPAALLHLDTGTKTARLQSPEQLQGCDSVGQLSWTWVTGTKSDVTCVKSASIKFFIKSPENV